MPQVTSSFPVIHSVLDPTALRAEVAAQYTLGEPDTCILLRSWINEVYQLRIGAQHFILKVFRHGWRSPAEVAYEVALMQHLATCGLSVAPPVARRDSGFVGLIPAPEGTRPTVLYPLLVGQPPLPPSELIYQQVGQAIATIHQALDSFETTHPRRALDVAYLAEEPLHWLHPHLRDRPADWEFLKTLVQRVRTRLTTLEQNDGLTWGAIHGDATLDNMLITETRKIGIYDFDQSGPGWRAYELQGVFQYTLDDPASTFWTALVDGYRSVQPLSTADIAAMPCFVVLNSLWCMGFEAHVIASNYGQWIVNSAYFDERLANLRRWAAAHSELSEEC